MAIIYVHINLVNMQITQFDDIWNIAITFGQNSHKIKNLDERLFNKL